MLETELRSAPTLNGGSCELVRRCSSRCRSTAQPVASSLPVGLSGAPSAGPNARTDAAMRTCHTIEHRASAADVITLIRTARSHNS